MLKVFGRGFGGEPFLRKVSPNNRHYLRIGNDLGLRLLHIVSVFEGFIERYLVGVFEYTADREAECKS